MKLSRFIKVIPSTIVAIMWVTSIPTHASTIYSWTDENGVVHFTDQPQTPDATAYPLSVTEVSGNIEQTADTIDTQTTDLTVIEEPAKTITTVSLVSPMHEQTIRNNEGIINIHAVTNSKLNNQTQAQLVVDGVVKGEPQTELTWTLDNIDRGSHQLQIQLVKGGKVIASSDSITVYLHRATVKANKPIPVQPR
ncbi:DUF4124 domain-containing protein [Photobacterium angustum]|uniref:DUF4124 domain-containing protein n=1 Tax=Photobacterium angustum TaxID=661 RepID=A0A855S8I2_PHOAN|nr:DUF4124 domain-containing protein [Photobacterium angustum]KJF80284.1 hypothetical protein UB36_18090 [Photobacterium damselae subsp. damselae]KJG36856.1 hypothetical protein UA35_18490 [Photobacterium angustum]KJG43741.1 hypothetical protein UA31_18095 [Photobacterium angustum]KJG46283.1 hypothetical protein UA30_18010 [Photobacterium angustum]KJG51655.1 hypothetical protein UA34_17790 [Photobacterium angustum]